jgi:hypothetical protein
MSLWNSFRSRTLTSGQIPMNVKKTTNHNTDNKINRFVTVFAFAPTT